MISVQNSKIGFSVAFVALIILGIYTTYAYFSYKDVEREHLLEVVGAVEYYGELSTSSIEIIIERNTDKYLIHAYAVPALDFESFAEYINEGGVIYILTAEKGEKYKKVYEIKSDDGSIFLDFNDALLLERKDAKIGLYVGAVSIPIGIIGIIVVVFFPNILGFNRKRQ